MPFLPKHYPRFFWATYLILIHVSIVVLLVKTDSYARFSEWMGWQQDMTSSQYYRGSHQDIVRQTGTLNETQVLIVGDSHVAGLNVALLGISAINAGIGGDTSKGLASRLPRYIRHSNPNTIVVGIGTNDIPHLETKAIVDNVAHILDMTDHIQRVYVMAILPVSETYRSKHKRPLEKILQTNAALETLTNSFSNTQFLPVPSGLTALNGYLLPRMHENDGLHLSKLGYATWQKELANIWR